MRRRLNGLELVATMFAGFAGMIVVRAFESWVEAFNPFPHVPAETQPSADNKVAA